MYAAAGRYANYPKTARLLLEYGANVNTKDNDGQLHNIITQYLIIVSLVYSIYL